MASVEPKSLLILLFLIVPSISFGYYITVDPHEEECFYDKVTSGTKMGFIFEVAEGGFMDIDVTITGPDQKIIYSGEKESSGKYTFSAYTDGIYRYCFANRVSSVDEKYIKFNMIVGESPSDQAKAKKKNEEHHDKLNSMISELSVAVSGIQHEQEYMELREKVHRTINDNTNSRVVWWSFFEALVLVALTVGQVYYLKRFFEVKRVV